MEYTPEDLVVEAETLVARLGEGEAAFSEVGRLMGKLAAQPGLLDVELAGLHGATAEAKVLARGPGGSLLMLARFPASQPTPIHNHNSWGVIRVVEGTDRHVRWRRTDDGSDPDRAELEMAADDVLEAGAIAWFGGPPDDIHSQQGIGGAAIELVYFGHDPDAEARSYYDLGEGTVSYSKGM